MLVERDRNWTQEDIINRESGICRYIILFLPIRRTTLRFDGFCGVRRNDNLERRVEKILPAYKYAFPKHHVHHETKALAWDSRVLESARRVFLALLWCLKGGEGAFCMCCKTFQDTKIMHRQLAYSRVLWDLWFSGWSAPGAASSRPPVSRIPTNLLNSEIPFEATVLEMNSKTGWNGLHQYT